MSVNGNWGACQWMIAEDGLLTISGGKAESIPSTGIAPWFDNREDIRAVRIDGQVAFDEGESLGCMFKDCVNLEEVDLEGLDTAGIISMHSFFEGCSSLTDVAVGGLDFSRVTSLSGMFNSCENLKQVDFSGADTSNLVNILGIFMNCRSLEEIDLSPLNTSNTVDMSWLFCGCENLKRVDLSMLDTGRAVDMSCMFLNCTSLEEVIFGGADLSQVMDASRMFMYCGKLKSIDFSETDNSSMEHTDDMFYGCAGLRSLAMGEKFSLLGGGQAAILLPEDKAAESGLDRAAADAAGSFGETLQEDGGEAMSADEMKESEWRRSRDDVYYIPGTRFVLRYDGSGAEGEMEEVWRVAGESVTLGLPAFDTPKGKVFREWNTRASGMGRTFQPGDEITLYGDKTLYAIWAGRPQILQEYEIPQMAHDEAFQLQAPDVDPCFGEITALTAQIQRPGQKRWEDIAEGQSAEKADDGSLIRYRITNYVGTTCTEPAPLHVDKAHYDMSAMHWELPEDLTYNGEEKSVHLEGLPEGMEVSYTGQSAVNVGSYVTTAKLTGDEENYYPPEQPQPLTWSIGRGRYDMKDIGWSYMEAFTYDGQSKSIRLDGLPEGTTAYYDGADAVDVGTYIATAGLDYDIDNYERPEGIRPCTWEIRQTTHDMSNVSWGDQSVFVYDGGEKKVELIGLPEGVSARYTGNQATAAGQYTARAAFVVDDPKNYMIPEPISFDWEIRKADHDMSRIAWSEAHFVYDGQEKEMTLDGVPEGVTVAYEGTKATAAGNYTARAEFLVDDLHNYNPLSPVTCSWCIDKAVVDLSATRWNYSSPYIYNGSVKEVGLKNVPETISVRLEDNQAVEAGTYEAKAFITYDAENYEEPVIEPCSWEIQRAVPKLDGIQWNYGEAFVYDGQEHGIELVNVPETFTVRYEDNRATTAGSYTAKAFLHPVDEQNYRDPLPLECRWEIRKALFDISGIHWNAEKKRTYDGSGQSVAITDLPEGITASYTGNAATAAGSYTAKAVFEVADKTNFRAPDPMEVEWSIGTSDLDLSGLSWDYEEPFVYNGQVQGISLKGVPEDIVVRYEDASAMEAGEYVARAELIVPEGSNYHNTKTLGQLWKIEKADIDVSGVFWEDPGRLVYDGTMKEVRLSGLPASVNAEYEGNRQTDAGEYEASVRLHPVDPKNHREPSVEGTAWSIEKAQIELDEVEWTDSTDYVYDGTVHRVIIRDLPETLEAFYDSNEAMDAGQYVATASFMPIDEKNYVAPSPRQHAWAIARADIDMSDVRWGLQKVFTYNGQPHRIELENLPINLDVSYQGNEAVDAGQYIAAAELTPTDPDNYNVPAVDPQTWEISKVDIDMSGVSWVSAERLVYDGNLKVIGLTGLPEDVDVEYENNVATDAGTYHASAVLSLDSANYRAPEIKGCTWTIEKATPSIEGVAWNYLIDFVYDGYEKRVELTELPPGMTAVYQGNAAIEAGTYRAEVKLIMDDQMNYEAPVIEPLEWTIQKRDYDMSTVAWTGEEGLVYDGTKKEVVMTGLEEGLDPIYEGNTGVDAGEYTATVRFLYDEDNYNPPPQIEHTWRIEKAPLDISGARWDYDGPLRAGRKPGTVTLALKDGSHKGGGLFRRSREENYAGLPEGTTVRYEGNSAKDPGIYEAVAYLTIPEQPNHEVKEPLRLTWEITDGKG